MKISLAWIFDHIDASLKNHDVEKLVGEFNRKTAEIDGVHRVLVDFKPFFLGRVKSIADNKMMLEVDELKVEVSLPSHELWLEKFTGDRDVVFMLRRSREGWAWACHRDFGCDKDGPLPAFYVLEKDQAGEWRNGLESEDVILEVDNKSITHRPDMWGHRGFAREVAAILGLKMLAEDDLLEDLDAVFEEKRFEPNSDVPFKISIESPARCKKFTGTFLTSIKNRPSNLFVAMRILRLGSRVIDGIVDMTNYVMADWSQPVHAYDAKLLKGNEIVVREAKSGEKVTLLDGTKLELTKEDLVIADAEAPLCLAGIKGGANSGISSSTTSILFEAATFDAASVRRTAARHGVRTDSSARFEKTLSTEQPVEAVRRFVKLATAYGLAPVVSGQIACVGVSQGEKTIGVTHEFLTTRSGIHLDTSFVSSSLEALGFEVSQVDTEHGMMYEIKVPHFRASKDVSIKEDILEEIIRFYGFAEFPTAIPPVAKQPENIGIIMKERTVRNFLAHGAQMMEVKNYAYYDEDFMSEVGLPTGGS
ncbi:hypothetical protein HOD08_01460, partial [bacterium]|nr:hypothetical protein [bacterium]